MNKISFNEALEDILREDSRYQADAYFFIREALDHTMKLYKRDADGMSRHVSGRELLEGIRLYALKEYGPMARSVLEFWGVNRCEDFGFLVFNLVNKGVLGKTEEDKVEDFFNGYDFEEAFTRPYQPLVKGCASAALPRRDQTPA